MSEMPVAEKSGGEEDAERMAKEILETVLEEVMVTLLSRNAGSIVSSLQVWGDGPGTELAVGEQAVACSEAKDLCHVCWEHLKERVVSGVSLLHERVELLQLRALEQRASGESYLPVSA